MANKNNPFDRADATIASQATGAMSWAFISALKQNPKQSYVQLLNSIRDILETKYTQKPQLSCSHPLGESLCCSVGQNMKVGVTDIVQSHLP